MMRIALFTGIVCIGVLSCVSYATRLTNGGCINETGKTIVLIAMQGGQFKDSVITVVKSVLENESFCVKIISLGRLKDEIVENYKALVIVNTCHMGNINGGVAKYLKKLSIQDKKKVVLFTTTGGDGWRPKQTDVDCVTAASKLINAQSVADSIITKTRAVFGARN
jgi:hypothetical protein